MKEQKREVLSERLDMKVSERLKDALIAMAKKDRRELSDFIRFKLEDIAFNKLKSNKL